MHSAESGQRTREKWDRERDERVEEREEGSISPDQTMVDGYERLE